MENSVKYSGTSRFDHSTPQKTGVLITNLGTPQAPTKKAVKPYLRQFLSDPRVVEVPRILWWCILNGVILNIRPKRSAESYKKVWTENGSPLALYTASQAEKLQTSFGEHVVIESAMRYGQPDITGALERLQKQNCRRLLVIPLYPQYSASTTGSTFDALADNFKKQRWIPELRFVSSYHDHPGYISALAKQVQSFWSKHGKPEKLVMSYHGVPVRYFHNGDPYHCQCLKTSRLLADALGLSQQDYLTTFQSRFGREPWLKPYTDETLKQLAQDGIEHVQVVCPGFSSDCLETIEEIDLENREYFLGNGGKQFDYIPALNDSSGHIDFLTNLVHQHIQGWSTSDDCIGREERRAECPYNQIDNN